MFRRIILEEFTAPIKIRVDSLLIGNLPLPEKVAAIIEALEKVLLSKEVKLEAAKFLISPNLNDLRNAVLRGISDPGFLKSLRKKASEQKALRRKNVSNKKKVIITMDRGIITEVYYDGEPTDINVEVWDHDVEGLEDDRIDKVNGEEVYIHEYEVKPVVDFFGYHALKERGEVR